jgi:hypothetical protein
MVSAPRVQIVPAPPTPAQARAWAKLWTMLLADDENHPEYSNASSGDLEALSSGRDPLARCPLGKLKSYDSR